MLIVIAFNNPAFGHDRTVTFSTSGPGVSKSISNWGLDTAWFDENNVRRGAVFMGPERVDVVRVSFMPTSALVNGDLQAYELNILNQRLDWVDRWTNSITTVCINEDSPTVDAYFIGGDGYINPAAWAELIDVTAAHAQARGRTVVAVAPFNEPDLYRAERLADMQTFYDTAGVLLGISRFNSIRISGGNTLNTDQANPWYNYLINRLGEGNTHQLAGNFDNYASFFQNVVSHSDHATNDELHNVMEAMVGAEYGMQTGIWWGTAERARGEFVKASDGLRLGYAEHRPNWTAASVYRALDGKVQAFVGESERQALPTTYRFVSLDRNVFYDGYGPQREYTLTTTGGPGYQTSAHRNAERVVDITWGDDIQPVIDGSYYVVNRKSKKVMEVASSSTDNGANIQQNAYDGDFNQQWDITPLAFNTGGDYSYFTLTAAHSQKAADVYGWSLDDSGDIRQWEYLTGVNQQWYFEYIEDGWFTIRSRWSGKYLNVSGGSIGNGANIQQYSLYPSDPERQQWRLIPINADPADFTAPATPTGITASANPVSVQLTWNANSESDLAGYTVLRSTTNGGPYEIIARGVTTNTYTDCSANQVIPYYYIIKAVDKSLNRSSNSVQVSATPTGITTLVAQYNFDGNEEDASINANHGMVNGTVGYGTGIGGSDSLILDGSSGHISLPGEVANFDDITIAAWVNWNGGGAWQRIFDFGNDTGYNMFLTPSSGSGTLRFAIKNGGGEQVTETAALAMGTWVHVAVTLNGNTATLYVNGSAAAFNNSTTINPTDFTPVCNYIGKSQWPDPLFNGQIDDFRIYNFALSSTQIATIKAENTAPSFTSDPIDDLDNAIELTDYTGQSLSSYGFSPDGDAYTFSKESGPDWLVVASDGFLSGIPYGSDVGLNVFTIRVANSVGLFDTAEVNIQVANVYNGTQGMEDLLGLSTQWLMTGCTDTPACNGADLDGDFNVTFSDVSVLSHNWQVDETLQLHLHLNESNGDIAKDSSIYRRDGLLVNGPTWSSGPERDALDFDGVDDYIQIPGYKGVAGTTPRTCAFWIKTSANYMDILGWGRLYNENQQTVTGQKWQIVFYNEEVGALVQGGNAFCAAGEVNDGQWHHVAAVLEDVNDDGILNINETQFYIDGLARTLSRTTSYAVTTAASNDVHIGKYPEGNTYLLNGLLNEIRIYDRALTIPEIQEITTP